MYFEDLFVIKRLSIILAKTWLNIEDLLIGPEKCIEEKFGLFLFILEEGNPVLDTCFF